MSAIGTTEPSANTLITMSYNTYIQYHIYMDSSRILNLKKVDKTGKCIVYIMSRDQRINDNHALLLAQAEASTNKLSLVVYFNLLTSTGFRTYEQYYFMLQGLKELSTELTKYNIPFILRYGDAQENIIKLTKELNPSSVYFDFSPLKGPRNLAKKLSKILDASCYVVDTHNIIPVWITSDKQEFAAHTIRNKIHKQLATWVKEPNPIKIHPYTLEDKPESLNFENAIDKIQHLKKSGTKINFPSGEIAANLHLENFIKNNLADYALGRNDIANDKQSNLSPYLHFGQLSSLRVALEIIKSVDKEPLLFEQALLAKGDSPDSKENGMNALLEEMIVRKELADNYCFYSQSYTSLDGAPKWAVESLSQHQNDPRQIYTPESIEQAETDDPAFNAAQKQLTRHGKIHGYMRMYWAKKILEWSDSAQVALDTTIYLNDKYSIDGGDPNGYTGIMWAITGLHDRPWFEREIFGKIRYMNIGGLQRKFDLDKYIRDNS